MKIYIIAGEASGDLYGGMLIEALKKQHQDIEFHFWGGGKMSDAANIQPVNHYSETAIMGFWEVVTQLPKVLGFLTECKADIENFKPDAIILIDYPGFNLRIAKWAKQKKYKVFYFIAPKVWAWKESRVNKIRKYTDHLYCILPFERNYFANHNVQASYEGHPLLDIVSDYKVDAHFAKNIPKQRKIALLPGSRRQEIEYIFPIMNSYAKMHPETIFYLAQAPSVEDDWFTEIVDSVSENIHFHTENHYDIYSISDVAIVASGTATLEVALFNLPQVVVYKGHWLSFMIGRYVVDLDYISLVNLILNREAVTELLQGDLTLENLEKEVKTIENPENLERMKTDYRDLKLLLEPKNSIKRIAKSILGKVIK